MRKILDLKHADSRYPVRAHLNVSCKISAATIRLARIWPNDGDGG